VVIDLLFVVEVFVVPIGEEVGGFGCAFAKVPGRSNGASVHRVTVCHVCQLRLPAEVCSRSLRANSKLVPRLL
jgi:hypothetical protein